jgi:ribosomal protein S18 acetylase RimI-like enzyme
MEVREARADDNAIALSRRVFGDDIVVGHDTVFDMNDYPALVAVDEGHIVGVLQYLIDDDGLEVVAIAADPPGRGAGRALLRAAARLAPRLRLTTTNDNLPALGLYQSEGFRIVAIRPDAVTRARLRKPVIPLLGYRGIPMCDELDLVREG